MIVLPKFSMNDLLSLTYSSKYTKHLNEELFRHESDFMTFLEGADHGKFGNLTVQLDQWFTNSEYVKIELVISEIYSFCCTSLLGYEKEIREVFIQRITKELDSVKLMKMLDIQYHMEKYIIKVIKSILLVFKVHSSIYLKSKSLKILRDLTIMIYDLIQRYVDGRIFADFKSLMNHTDYSVLVGSFRKQYKRLTLGSSPYSLSFRYSIEMMKKGFHTLSLRKTMSNVQSTLKELTTQPDVVFDEASISRYRRLCNVAINLINPKTGSVDFSDINVSSRSSYDFPYGFGASWLSVKYEVLEPFNSMINPERPLNIFETTQVNETVTELVNYFTESPTHRKNFIGPGIDPVTGKFKQKLELGPSQGISRILPNVPMTNRASIRILQEPNKNRFLTIQSWYYQNLFNSVQKRMLNDWFNSSFSTKHGVDEEGLLRKCDEFPHKILGFESVDYTAATDKLYLQSTRIYIEEYLRYIYYGKDDAELTAVLEALDARNFDVKHMNVDHSNWDDLEKDILEESLSSNSDIDKKLFKKVYSHIRYNYFQKNFGAYPLQRNGQMMGNPLSFGILCGLNLVTYLATLEDEFNLVFESLDKYGILVTNPENNNIDVIDRVHKRSKFLRDIMGPVIINGDDALFPILSENTKTIHRYHAANFGLEVNDTKSKESYWKMDFKRDSNYSESCSFNINSIQYILSRDQDSNLELQDTGYFNLNLFLGQNVKQRKESHDLKSIGDEYDTMIRRLITEDLRQRVHSAFVYEHSTLIEKGVTTYIYDRATKTREKDISVFALSLPPSLGGINMFQSMNHQMLEDIIKNGLSIGKRVFKYYQRTFDISYKKTWSMFTPKDLITPPPQLSVTPAEIHSEILTYLAKIIVLDLWHSNKQTITLSLNDSNGVGLTEAIDYVLNRLQETFKNFVIYNFKEQGVEKLLEGLTLVDLNDVKDDIIDLVSKSIVERATTLLSVPEKILSLSNFEQTFSSYYEMSFDGLSEDELNNHVDSLLTLVSHQ